jgi:hypothetical protein
VEFSSQARESFRGDADEEIAGGLMTPLEEMLYGHALSVEEFEKRPSHAGTVGDADEAQLDKAPGDLEGKDLQGFNALHRRGASSPRV